MLRKRLEPLTFFYEGVFMVTDLACMLYGLKNA